MRHESAKITTQLLFVITLVHSHREHPVDCFEIGICYLDDEFAVTSLVQAYLNGVDVLIIILVVTLLYKTKVVTHTHGSLFGDDRRLPQHSAFMFESTRFFKTGCECSYGVHCKVKKNV